MVKVVGGFDYALMKKVLYRLETILGGITIDDHVFMPETKVTDEGTVINVKGGIVLKLKNLSNHPCFFNLDRPITSNEYGIVPPMSYLVIVRRANKVYLKAPMGQECMVKVDALVVMS